MIFAWILTTHLYIYSYLSIIIYLLLIIYIIYLMYIIFNNKYNKYLYNEWISTVDILWRRFRRKSKGLYFCNPLYTLKILQSYKSYDFYNLTTLRIFSRWPSRGARFRCRLEWHGSSAAQALLRFLSILTCGPNRENITRFLITIFSLRCKNRVIKGII